MGAIFDNKDISPSEQRDEEVVIARNDIPVAKTQLPHLLKKKLLLNYLASR